MLSFLEPKPEEGKMRTTFFVISLFFALICTTTVFAQGYHSAEIEISAKNEKIGLNALGYSEIEVYEQGDYANSLFMFTSINESFSQLYGGLTMSVGELSAGAGAGITNETNLRTALFASWTEEYYMFSAVGEMDWNEEDAKENFFYKIKFLAHDPENIFAGGWVFRRFSGLGPLFEFKFGKHLTIWGAPGMWDVIETGNISSMFGFRLD